jgi:hypothetical protein
VLGAACCSPPWPPPLPPPTPRSRSAATPSWSGFGDEPAYAGQPNSLQVLITRDGKPATDLAGKLDGLMAHAYYGRKADPKFENAMMPLEPRFGDDWGTPGDYRSFFVPTQAGRYTFELKGKLGDQKINLVVPSGPGDLRRRQRPGQGRLPAAKDPTTAQLAQRLDRETARLNADGPRPRPPSGAAEDGGSTRPGCWPWAGCWSASSDWSWAPWPGDGGRPPRSPIPTCP